MVNDVKELVEKLKYEAKAFKMSVLIIAEHDNNILKSSTLNTISAALKLSEDIHH